MSLPQKEPLLFSMPSSSPPPPPLKSADEQSRLERELRHISSVISIFAYMTFVASMVCISITAGIFFTSPTLNADRRVFFLGILGVCFLGLILVILISRRHPTTLLLFNILLAIISAFALGLSITYA